jgi:phosphatidylethanolamine-binding protein (PEBP) family uncharacterized protein
VTRVQSLSRSPVEVIVLLASVSLAFAGVPAHVCSYQTAHDDPDAPQFRWQFPIGATLTGVTRLDFDGDGHAQVMKVVAEVQRDKTGDRWCHCQIHRK